MGTTHFRKNVNIAVLSAAAADCTVLSATTADCASLAISTTFTPPAQSVTLGLGTASDATSKLDGVYLSFAFDGASSQTTTHGIGATCIGWIVTRTDAALATAQGVFAF